MKQLIGIVVFIAVLLLVARLFHVTYEAPQILTPPGQTRLSLTCAIVATDAQRQSGNAIPGMDVGAHDLALVRPVGEMLSGFLLTAAQVHFKQARLVSSRQAAEGSDIVVELVKWEFGFKDKDTGYNFTGLPLLIATGRGFVTLHAEFSITGNRIASFTMKESAKGTRKLGIALFPVSRLSRTMTEASDQAAAALAQSAMDKIAKGSRVNTLKTLEQQSLSEQADKQNRLLVNK